MHSKVVLTYLIFLLTFFWSIPATSLAQNPKKNGVSQEQLAIDFQATGLDGKPFQGKKLKGKTVLLDFWAIWCGPCIAAFPTLKKLNHDLKEKNFEVVGIAAYSGTREDVRKFVEKQKLVYKVVVGDVDLVERFGVIGFPSYFLIGPDGKIHKNYVGEAKTLYADVKKEVLKLNKVKPR